MSFRITKKIEMWASLFKRNAYQKSPVDALFQSVMLPFIIEKNVDSDTIVSWFSFPTPI